MADGFLAPGIHMDIPASRYHADPCEIPSLSSSIAKLMLDGAAVHAWHAHTRLGGALTESEPSRVKEIGTAVHKMILGRGSEVVPIAGSDYRATAAKIARAEAYAAGKAPILTEDTATATAMAEAFVLQLARISECSGFFSPGAESEVVVIARDPSGAMLRIMVDRLEITDQGVVAWDVKSGAQSAAPQGLGKRIEGMAMEVQAALYVHVLALAMPHMAGRITFRWIFIENDPPHLLLPCELDATGMEIGHRKMMYAIALWQKCMTENSWPGYPAEIVRAEYPAWAMTRWLEREEAYAAAGIDGMANAPAVEREPRKILGAC